MFGTYQCVHCENKIEYRKPYGEEFPDEIKEVCCKGKKECVHKRVFTVPVVSVATGHFGNAENGYSHSHVYKPSPFTPTTKTRKSKVDTVVADH